MKRIISLILIAGAIASFHLGSHQVEQDVEARINTKIVMNDALRNEANKGAGSTQIIIQPEDPHGEPKTDPPPKDRDQWFNKLKQK
jgi:hypothetical protein